MLNFVIAFDNSLQVIEVGSFQIWLTVLSSLGGVFALYLLRSLGLYSLSKRAKLKLPWLAFVPAAWIYNACELAGDQKLIRSKLSKYTVFYTVAFIASEALTFLFLLLTYIPLIGYYIQGGTVYMVGDYAKQLVGSSLDSSISVYKYDAAFCVGNPGIVYPYPQWFESDMLFLSFVQNLLGIVCVFITINVYIALFKKYWPRHYILASLLSALVGLFGVFVFIIRNNEPVDYTEYIKNRYSAYGTPYGMPYGTPYGRPYGERENNSQSQPFSEYDQKEKKPEDPFEEFPDDRDNFH